MPYPPPHYTDDDTAFARRIMAEHGFALLVADGLAASHLPLLFRHEGPRGALYGHLTRANPICAADNGAGLDGRAALAVFSGPHAYVSATLHDDPARAVPTWNYASVQARGTLRALPDAAVRPHLDEMAQAYEGRDGWSVSDAPDYVAALTHGIIAFRLEIDRLTAFRKMSADKPLAMRKRIIDATRAQGEHAFANEMATTLTITDPE
ncbi:FMN-binding negative transcriptional regulator [uncultured Algimonas sp.]|uniref:FMN-binding negative transcriptional regulator n=1 Tax=uncultured Algimonas sp. TaxID=1547920 RepID=UPI00260DB85A|nr:FMN-binding negative transcriptional regulator [uncultured Algimonas sp.]